MKYVSSLLVLALLGASSARAMIIGGTNYVTSGPTESLTVLFTDSNGAPTTGTYNGYVQVSVSGVGQSLGTLFNDAFYVFTAGVFHDSQYYQLAFDTVPLVPFNPSRDAKNFIVYDIDAGMEVTPAYVPVYNPNHVYNFVLNTSLIAAGTLHFGTSNGNFADNSGSHTIQITQLVASNVPDGGATLLLLGGAFALLAFRRTRKAA